METKDIKYDRALIASTMQEEWCVRVYQIQNSTENIRNFIKTRIPKIISFITTNNDGNTLKPFPFSNGVVRDEFELRADYRGQTFIRRPIYIDHKNGIYHITDIEGKLHTINAYIVVDKRELKASKRVYRKYDKEQLQKLAEKIITDFIKDFNHMANGSMLQCELLFEGEPTQTINFIPLDNVNEMESFVLDQLAVVNPMVDTMIQKVLDYSAKRLVLSETEQ